MNELIVEKSTLESVRIIIPPTIFEDHRGIYTETYNRRIYSNAGIEHITLPAPPLIKKALERLFFISLHLT